MTRCEALQARKIRSKSESEATAEEEQKKTVLQPPVCVSVNGKNITLFGNQMQPWLPDVAMITRYNQSVLT